MSASDTTPESNDRQAAGASEAGDRGTHGGNASTNGRAKRGLAASGNEASELARLTLNGHGVGSAATNGHGGSSNGNGHSAAPTSNGASAIVAPIVVTVLAGTSGRLAHASNGDERIAANGHGPSASSGGLIAPHGGSLVKLWATPAEVELLDLQAKRFPAISLNLRQQADVELLANGALSPLHGFLGRDDFESVLEHARLASGVVWTIPIVLDVDAETAGRLTPGDRVALHDHNGTLLAVLDLSEKYTYDRDEYALRVFGTTETAHPGVKRIYEQGDWLLAGSLTVLRRPETIEFPQYHLDPVQTRALIEEKGWRTVVGFQTRNPIHRAHEFILKSALEIFDALLIQPLVGETRDVDIPARVRLRCYEVLIEGYYPKDRTLLAVLPAVMRFAGPREAVFHALIRKNYGCTHFIVGRDHAGVGNYYGTYDAQLIFDTFTPEEIGIHPLRFEHTFYCSACQGMASSKTCPHPTDKHLTLSGTRVREMLAQRETPPVEFTRPEVARVLMEMTSATKSF